jgi:hypothetical protein
MMTFARRPGAWYTLSVAAPLFAVVTSTASATDGKNAPPCEAPVLTLPEAAELLRIDVEEMDRLAERDEVPGRIVGAEWRFNCASLLEWLDGATGGQGEPATPTGLIPDDGEDTPIGEAPEERTAEDVLLRSQRVLLGPGETVLDFGQFYTEFNGQPLASVGGSAALSAIEQETFLTSLQARIGFRNETEVFVGTTYFDQDSDVFLGSQKIASTDTSDFGSVSFGVRHTLMREGRGRPDIVGALATSIPTGETSYTLGAALAFVKSIDPVVLFANIGYTHVFTRDFAELTRLEPRDRLDVGSGYALALNDTLALSMAVSGFFTAATEFDGIELRQQDGYALRFGLNSWLARGVYIEPSVTFNLGGPDDSFAFGITVPYTLGR